MMGRNTQPPKIDTENIFTEIGQITNLNPTVIERTLEALVDAANIDNEYIKERDTGPND